MGQHQPPDRGERGDARSGARPHPLPCHTAGPAPGDRVLGLAGVCILVHILRCHPGSRRSPVRHLGGIHLRADRQAVPAGAGRCPVHHPDVLHLWVPADLRQVPATGLGPGWNHPPGGLGAPAPALRRHRFHCRDGPRVGNRPFAAPGLGGAGSPLPAADIRWPTSKASSPTREAPTSTCRQLQSYGIHCALPAPPWQFP